MTDESVEFKLKVLGNDDVAFSPPGFFPTSCEVVPSSGACLPILTGWWQHSDGPQAKNITGAGTLFW